jgi:hypothetical protein
MFRWLKQRLFEWVGREQQQEIERLHRKAVRLKAEVERQTGKPAQLSPEARRRLAEKAQRIDPETFKQISVFDPEDLHMTDPGSDSTENR